MKMSKARYDLLKTTITAVAGKIGLDKCREYANRRNAAQLMWSLHHKATDQLQYDESHPFYQDGTWEKIVPHVEGFKIYDDNGTTLNDDHIETALRRIGRELDLIAA